MTLLELASDPRAQIAASLLLASASSTAHTFLDKHPRLQAVAQLVSNCVGPLNLPAMKKAGVALCRAVVAYEDQKNAPAKTLTRAAFLSALEATPSPIQEEPGAVKAWPQS